MQRCALRCDGSLRQRVTSRVPPGVREMLKPLELQAVWCSGSSCARVLPSSGTVRMVNSVAANAFRLPSSETCRLNAATRRMPSLPLAMRESVCQIGSQKSFGILERSACGLQIQILAPRSCRKRWAGRSGAALCERRIRRKGSLEMVHRRR